MKKVTLLLMVICTATIITSCKKTINGSGHYVDENRTLTPFTSVESDGDFIVTITKDSIQSLSIHAEDNIIPEIETVVEGTNLIIRYKNSKNEIHDNGVTVSIYIPQIVGLNMQGSGNMTCTGTFDTTSANINISGSGNIDYSVNCQDITTNISGSGSITLHGTSVNSNHTISGSGDIHAYDLPCSTTQITISGSGNCEVNVIDQLIVNISGSGDVIYMGNPPSISINISGSGHVHPF